MAQIEKLSHKKKAIREFRVTFRFQNSEYLSHFTYTQYLDTQNLRWFRRATRSGE